MQWLGILSVATRWDSGSIRGLPRQTDSALGAFLVQQETNALAHMNWSAAAAAITTTWGIKGGVCGLVGKYRLTVAVEKKHKLGIALVPTVLGRYSTNYGHIKILYPVKANETRLSMSQSRCPTAGVGGTRLGLLCSRWSLATPRTNVPSGPVYPMDL